jgi:geranylgeranyl diphosphate synthase type II
MERQSWKELAQLVEKALTELALGAEPKELYEPISYTLSMGGKRVRPVLCLLAAQLFGGDLNKAMSAALSIEVFHNFTLVHDDIMDEAPLRRGMPTVHAKWNRDIAILSGDVMMVKAYELLIQSGESKVMPLLKVFNQTAVEVCEGQQLDMNFELEKSVELSQYIRMIELKTAVLLACSLKIGAMLAGASEKDAEHIYEFGRNIGIAFQIQDDYLDTYADPNAFGKRVGGDIVANKKTYLLLAAYSKASKTQEEQLNHLMGNTLNEEEKINQTLALYNELGVPELSRSKMEEFYAIAMRELQEIDVTDAAKKPLLELAEQLMNRNQ